MYSMTSNALLTKTSHPLNHGKVNKTAQLCVAGDAVETQLSVQFIYKATTVG